MAVTKYVWDELSDNLLMETDEIGSTTATYTNETEQYGGLISQRRNGTTSYHHFDGIGSTRELTDSSETVTDTNLYDAYGVNIDSTGTTENPFCFVGRLGYYCDKETSAYYIRVRMYEPGINRWTAIDPIYMPNVARLSTIDPTPTNGFALFGGLREYAYADINPVNRADLSGQQPQNAGRPKGTPKARCKLNAGRVCNEYADDLWKFTLEERKRCGCPAPKYKAYEEMIRRQAKGECATGISRYSNCFKTLCCDAAKPSKGACIEDAKCLALTIFDCVTPSPTFQIPNRCEKFINRILECNIPALLNRGFTIDEVFVDRPAPMWNHDKLEVRRKGCPGRKVTIDIGLIGPPRCSSTNE